MILRCTLAVFALAAATTLHHGAYAQCDSRQCTLRDIERDVELASLETAVLPPPAASAETPRAKPEATSLARPSPRTSGTIFLQLRQYAGLGLNRGSLNATTLDIGVGFPLGTPHLVLQIGMSIGFGSYRDVLTRTSSAYLEMGMFSDALVYLNVSRPARLFVVSGARFSMGGPLVHEVTGGDEECPALITVEGSLGVGGEFRWGRRGLVSMSIRGLRRRAIGELVFAANGGGNPPLTSTRGAWGLAATIQVGAEFK